MIRSSLSAILLSVVCAAGAAEISAYGFTLGKPLGLPECKRLNIPPMKNYTPPYANVTAPCLKPTGAATGSIAFPISAPARHVSGSDLGYGLAADGSLAVIVVPTAGAPVQRAVYEDLVAKYGQPTTSSAGDVTSGSGARFQLLRASWMTDALRIEFTGADGRIDIGRVLIGTPSGVDDRIRMLSVALAARPL
jgi:hypothetical protein